MDCQIETSLFEEIVNNSLCLIKLMKKEETEREMQDGCHKDMFIVTENQEILSKLA